MAANREQLLYVAVDSNGRCRAVPSPRQPSVGTFSQAVSYLGQLLDEGWQLVSENSACQSESSIVLLRRKT